MARLSAWGTLLCAAAATAIPVRFKTPSEIMRGMVWSGQGGDLHHRSFSTFAPGNAGWANNLKGSVDDMEQKKRLSTNPMRTQAAIDMDGICDKARVKNHSLDITGFLIYNVAKRSVFQMFEGESEHVWGLWHSISRDPRHTIDLRSREVVYPQNRQYEGYWINMVRGELGDCELTIDKDEEEKPTLGKVGFRPISPRSD